MTSIALNKSCVLWGEVFRKNIGLVLYEELQKNLLHIYMSLGMNTDF